VHAVSVPMLFSQIQEQLGQPGELVGFVQKNVGTRPPEPFPILGKVNASQDHYDRSWVLPLNAFQQVVSAPSSQFRIHDHDFGLQLPEGA
jgi:hypothetical protein